MDISKASNFERFVFDLLQRDGARVKALFGEALAREGGFTLARDEFDRIAGYGFASGRSTHADRLATIRRTWQQHGVLIDPHTADGLKVALEQRDDPGARGVPMIVLETALPAKFAATIREATGVEPEVPAALRGIEALPRRFEVLPADVSRVRQYIEEHAPCGAA
jgi:threonine synthase